MSDILTADQILGYGLCECGCGENTRIATQNIKRLGHIKGHPVRFLVGHYARTQFGPSYRIDSETGCWEWLHFRLPDGYGWTRRGSKKLPAHRAMWMDIYGPLPGSIEVHHKCENRGCVNPDHLKTVHESKHKRLHSKLTEDQVREIRSTPRVRGSGRMLEQKFEVSGAIISQIRNGKSWKDV